MGAARVLRQFLAWTVGALGVAAPELAPAAVTTLVPTDDTYVRGGPTANDNFDADTMLRVKNGAGEDNDRETLIRFDLSGLQGVVVSATLQLYCKGLSNGSPTSVYTYSVAVDSWTETTVTWNTRPAAVSLLSFRGDIATVGQIYPFNVTSFVAQQNGGDRIVSFLLRDDGEVKRVADFDRREDSHPPTLVIETSQTYSLTAQTLGSGQVTLSPDGGVYLTGTVVTLTAVPGPGWQMSSWAGDLSGSANPAQLTMDANKTVWATFTEIPRYTLTPQTSGLGTVALSPSAPNYLAGTSVSLTATPGPGWSFDGWSGDLQSTANPSTIVMNAAKTVTASFHAAPATPSDIVLEEIASGGSTASTLVETAAPLAGIDANLYLAAVTTKPHRTVNSIIGLNLTWTLVGSQCSGRGESGVSLWMALGNKVTDATVVQAVLAAAADNAVVVVSRWSGVDRVQPLGTLVAGNSNGIGGACNGGIDATTYSVAIPDPGTDKLVFGVVAHREATHVPGSGWTERTEVSQGSAGSRAALSLVDHAGAGAPSALAGSFNLLADWAALAVQVRPAYAQTLSLSTTGLGSVALSPPGGLYVDGELVSLQPVPASGWYFAGWSADLSGASNPMSCLVRSDLDVAALFSTVPHYDLGVTVQGSGHVVVSPPGRRFAQGSTVGLMAEAFPGWIFSGWGGDAVGSSPSLALPMQSNRNVIAYFQFVGVPVAAGLWSSAAELATAPLQGTAWVQVLAGADQVFFPPNPANQDSPNNVNCLAAGIVFARTGNTLYRDRVVQALDYLPTLGNPGDNTLAWGRELGAYVLAADLVGYRTTAFDTWLRAMAETYVGLDHRTLLEAVEERPNNWGMYAFGSLAAVYAYLHDDAKLLTVRNLWVQGVTGTPAQGQFGDLWWQFDPARPRIINAARSTLQGVDIDGAIPDDVRRGGAFAIPPIYTNYPWGALQGMVMAARILERYDPNLSIWSIGEKGIYRAASLLQERWQQQFSGWKATGDDRWLLPFLDGAYGTHWASGAVDESRAGKNAGWAYVLLGGSGGGTTSTAPWENTLPYRLYPSTPNPFSRSASIRFSVPLAGPVRVVIYDAMGRRVATLLDGTCPPGMHALHWDGIDAAGRPVARGIYWCQLQAGSHRESIRLTLLH